MSKLSLYFDDSGWDDYLYWQSVDKKILKKINLLIEDTRRTPFSGLGKPEPLRDNYGGYWSRRITGEHRLIYTVTSAAIQVIACRYHYSKK